MSSVIRIVSVVFQAYQFLILIRVLLSWVNTNPYRPTIDHPLVRLLYQVTDPILDPLRRVIPAVGGMIDLSPMVALILLQIIRQMIISVLAGL